MILIFDLDDTLYPEITFVKSGFKAVSSLLQIDYGLDKDLTYRELMRYYKLNGRGKIFDSILKDNKIYSKKMIRKCISTYRLHKPNIQLYDEAKQFLKKCHSPLYLVTDGNKAVQKNKLAALDISSYFKRIFITHQYGIDKAKPSLYCFELIRSLEMCDWDDIIYVADDPTKDFIALNSKGSKTIRVLTGRYATSKTNTRFDGRLKISSLKNLEKVLKKI